MNNPACSQMVPEFIIDSFLPDPGITPDQYLCTSIAANAITNCPVVELNISSASNAPSRIIRQSINRFPNDTQVIEATVNDNSTNGLEMSVISGNPNRHQLRIYYGRELNGGVLGINPLTVDLDDYDYLRLTFGPNNTFDGHLSIYMFSNSNLIGSSITPYHLAMTPLAASPPDLDPFCTTPTSSLTRELVCDIPLGEFKVSVNGLPYDYGLDSIAPRIMKFSHFLFQGTGNYGTLELESVSLIGY